MTMKKVVWMAALAFTLGLVAGTVWAPLKSGATEKKEIKIYNMGSSDVSSYESADGVYCYVLHDISPSCVSTRSR